MRSIKTMPARSALAHAAACLFMALQMQAATAQTANFDIPPQPLAPALNQFARQAGLQLVFTPALAQGKQAPRIGGAQDVRQALDALLRGSGLRGQVEGGTLTVQLTAATSQADLAEVRVEANRIGDGRTEGSGAYTAPSASAATGLALTLRETPQSVSVITRQRMDDQGLLNLDDIARQTTGLTFAQYGPAGGDSNRFYARGFQVSNFQIDGVSRLFSDYVGIFQTNDLAIYDRAEIVRGATGLMNGVGTPGATINLVRKRPTAEFQGSAQLTAGRWDFRRAEVDVSTPVNEAGTVRARLSAVSQDNQSQVNYEQDRRRSVYGIVEADLGPSTLATVGFAVQDFDASGVGRSGRPFFYTDGSRTQWARSDSSGARWASTRRDNRSVFASLEHRFDNQWRLKTSFTHDQSSYDEVLGWTNEQPVDRASGAGVGMWAALWSGRPKQDTLDVNASGPFTLFGREHELAFGATVARTRNASQGYGRWSFDGWDPTIDNLFTWDGRTPVQPNNPALSDNRSTERSHSAFASARLRPTDALSVIVGARVTDWQRSDRSTPYATGLTESSGLSETGEVTPFAGVVYDIDRNWSVYGSYTNIFQPQSNRGIDGIYLQPLLGKSYEAGLKGAFLDDKLELSGAIYKTLQDNLAVAVPGAFAPDGSQAYRAESGTQTRGFELEATGRFSRDWQGSIGFSRNLTQDADGKALNTEIPRNMLKAFTTYRLAVAGRPLTLGAGVRWQNRTWSDYAFVAPAGADPIVEQKAYAIADLSARYDVSDRLSMAVHLYNVFDRKYRAISTSAYYGEGRNLRVSMAVKF